MKTKNYEEEGSADELVALLRRPAQWFKNSEIVKAVGWIDVRGNKSITGHWKDYEEWLGPHDSMLAPSDGGTGGIVRFYSKRAIILIGMRATTANAKAFQRWVSNFVMKALEGPKALLIEEREAFAAALSLAIISVLEGNGGDNDQK